MEIDFDRLDKEYEKYGDTMLSQEQVDSIFNQLSLKNELLVRDILLVDDAAFMRYVIKNILNENGYFVTCEAEDGVSAVKQYRYYRPHLVIMNITMPVLDGIAATRFIKEYDSEANVVMFSGISNYNTVKDSIIAGARGFIVGRFDIDKFINTISARKYANVEA